MGIVAAQLDKLAIAQNCRNSSGIAELLHVSRQTISLWRSQDAYPEQDRIAQMAELAGEDPALWLAQVQEERSHGKAQIAWHDVVRRLSVAAVLLCALTPEAPHARALTSAVVGIMRSVWTYFAAQLRHTLFAARTGRCSAARMPQHDHSPPVLAG